MIEKDYQKGWNYEGNLNKILSCPFCGGNGELLDNGYEHPVIDENGAYVDMDIFEGDTFWIECEKCGAMMTEADTPEKAIEEWNKRTGSGWIPVEERLPEESGYYRVTVKNTELGDITEETAWFAHVDDYDMDESEWRELYEYEEVIAWRELSPYSPEELERSEGE